MNVAPRDQARKMKTVVFLNPLSIGVRNVHSVLSGSISEWGFTHIPIHKVLGVHMSQALQILVGEQGF